MYYKNIIYCVENLQQKNVYAMYVANVMHIVVYNSDNVYTCRL